MKALITPVFSTEVINIITLFTKAWSQPPIFWRTALTPRRLVTSSVVLKRLCLPPLVLLYYNPYVIYYTMVATQLTVELLGWNIIQIVPKNWNFFMVLVWHLCHITTGCVFAFYLWPTKTSFVDASEIFKIHWWSAQQLSFVVEAFSRKKIWFNSFSFFSWKKLNVMFHMSSFNRLQPLLKLRIF